MYIIQTFYGTEGMGNNNWLATSGRETGLRTGVLDPRSRLPTQSSGLRGCAAGVDLMTTMQLQPWQHYLDCLLALLAIYIYLVLAILDRYWHGEMGIGIGVFAFAFAFAFVPVSVFVFVFLLWAASTKFRIRAGMAGRERNQRVESWWVEWLK